MSNQTEKKGIGTFDFFCIGFGAIVGVGWSVSINRWMANCGGPLPASLGYILALIMLVPVALCYCELAPMMPVAGGGMAYAYRAFNSKVAYITGWAATGAMIIIMPWEAIFFVDILSILLPNVLGPQLYVILEVPIHLGHILIGVVTSCILFWINWRGATTSALAQRVLTLILVGAGVLAMIFALIKFDISNFQPIYQHMEGRGTHSSFFGGAIAILASAPFFLAGFETIPQAVEEASGDVTSVGKTVVLSVGLACVFYAALLFCLGSAMPWQEFFAVSSPAASNLFLYAYPNSVLGIIMYYVLLAGALCGLLTSWNGFMIAAPRLMMGMARGYMLPRGLAKQHPKYGTPTNGLIVCLVLSIAGPFLGMGLIDPLTSFSAAGFVLTWMVTSFCVIKLRKSEPDAVRPYKLPGGLATAWFAAIMMAIVLVLLFIPDSPAYMTDIAVLLFIVWMAIGLVVYIATRRQRNAVSPAEQERSVFEKL